MLTRISPTTSASAPTPSGERLMTTSSVAQLRRDLLKLSLWRTRELERANYCRGPIRQGAINEAKALTREMNRIRRHLFSRGYRT